MYSFIIDTHVHVGQYFDQYISPIAISQLMNRLPVEHYAVSSTSTCEENYPKVLDELQELIELDGEKVLPVMWITPEGLKGNIAWFLESAIKWKCLKVHPFLHQSDWLPNGTQFREVIDIAKELRVPVLIHTGNEDCCWSGKYEEMIADNPDVNFILAHGRPLDQAAKLTCKYGNAYADSAFMPVEDMAYLVVSGLSSKLLWGTDMCIPGHFYPDQDMAEYYLRKLKAFRKVCSTEEDFNRITFKNATKLFSLEK